ncbi:MAG: type IV toxin-antitoxin system AbiEi family antitoxin domain-containing protein [Endomicrobiales bacterium]|nr:type IV toxin-antitoxin system AbiEi family antitoxin domain-containing protein [Endomicrobiales bacterium]
MSKQLIIIECIKKLNRPIFTTREITDLSGKSASNVTQTLNYLAQHNAIKKLHRGVWGEVTSKLISPYMLIPHLFTSTRVYVSFLSALHLHGIIEQIPQTITLASTTHTKKIRTAIGVFAVHQILPEFFSGFDWYKGTVSFLIAQPEKALADCLYLYTKKKKQYGHFPELNLKKPFRIQKVIEWIEKIPDQKSIVAAKAKLNEILSSKSTSL